MVGEGSMMHAIISIKNNRRNRISKLEKLKNTSNYREEFIDHKKASPELLRKIRLKLQIENKERNKKAILKTGLLLLLICIGIYIININWSILLNSIN